MKSNPKKHIDKMSDAEIEGILKQANQGITYQYFVDDWSGKSSQLLDIIRIETSCGLCGKLPCREDASMILSCSSDGGKTIILVGVCSNCQPSTRGQSELKIHYRSYLTSLTDLPKRFVVFEAETGDATPYGSPLPK